MLKYTNFSISIPVELHGKLKKYAEDSTRTMTGVVLESLRWRLEAELGGKRRCATGEPCALTLLRVSGPALTQQGGLQLAR